jgi:hypothetical protein
VIVVKSSVRAKEFIVAASCEAINSKMQKILSLGLTLSLIGVAGSYAIADSSDSSNLAKGEIPCREGLTSYVSQSGNDRFASLERNSLSKNARILVKWVYLQSGGIACTEVQQQSGSVSDSFYCEQALWDNAPCNEMPVSEHSEFVFEGNGDKGNSFNCVKTFFDANPGMKNEVVVMHVIPPSVAWRYPGLFSDDEIHGLKNLIAIPVTNVDSKLLLGVREEWLDYFKTHKKPNRLEVITTAGSIISMYSKAFAFTKLPGVIPKLDPWPLKKDVAK